MGKTTLVEMLLKAERLMGVETGGCPHTAIREDASINLEAVDRMLEKFHNARIVFIEPDGGNLAVAPNAAKPRQAHAPMLPILSTQHETQYFRLFRS